MAVIFDFYHLLCHIFTVLRYALDIFLPYFLTPTSKEKLLYGYIVPILDSMLEIRLGIHPSHTQTLTSAILGVHGLASMISGPIVAHLADKTPNRRTPLLLSLGGCLSGTILVAFCPSLLVLFLGRIIQAVAGAAVWIVGFATLADTVGLENMGKTLGMTMSFVVGGVLGGPMISGTLMHLAGYWPTWSAPLAILIIDIMLRLLMIERPKSATDSNYPRDEVQEIGETTCLLSPSGPAHPDKGYAPESDRDVCQSELYFLKTVLREGRVIVGLLASILDYSIMSSLETTLPLHVRYTFRWGSLSAGFMFLYFQLPAIFFVPIAGWLRDWIGLRYPVSLAFGILAPLLCLLGAPGADNLP